MAESENRKINWVPSTIYALFCSSLGLMYHKNQKAHK